ncbi:MAG: 1,4-dihydroxy-6-naphthoate synthase [Bacteroidetes bacterium]|nr:MAG: 1,4-dihydroxy-6-naphthoate synthase [Bacteroidota bacterium]RLD81155.1 MAG: 1,4-dihydroxy-6-naphthoate synthase [Bacteroidota bacterium]
MTLNLGFSTCPNDTFIFDAMVHHRIDTEGLEFELILADVEELNKAAFKHEIDITKLSYHAYAYIADNYVLLDSGSALGNKNGPLLISKRKIYPDEINDISIAIPGKYTTANLLLNIAYPDAKNKKEYLFSDIEEAILSNEVDAGLIIHENRFTYEQKGLKKIIDLGEFWETKTNLPIPLGGIVVNRKLPLEVQQKVNRVLRKSLEYAFENPNAGLPFIKEYSQEMDEEVMYKHIELYVNEYSLDLGKKGKKAIKKLYEIAKELNVIPKMTKQIFLA